MGETIQKRLKSKVVHKHELEVNWLKSTYLPEQGEWVVYDVEVDANGAVLELPEGRTAPYTYQRMKMGDGIHNVNQLPFITAKEAEKLIGYNIATALNDSDTEIPTSKAVLNAINETNSVWAAIKRHCDQGVANQYYHAGMQFIDYSEKYGNVVFDVVNVTSTEVIIQTHDVIGEPISIGYLEVWADVYYEDIVVEQSVAAGEIYCIRIDTYYMDELVSEGAYFDWLTAIEDIPAGTYTYNDLYALGEYGDEPADTAGIPVFICNEMGYDIDEAPEIMLEDYAASVNANMSAGFQKNVGIGFVPALYEVGGDSYEGCWQYYKNEPDPATGSSSTRRSKGGTWAMDWSDGSFGIQTVDYNYSAYMANAIDDTGSHTELWNDVCGIAPAFKIGTPYDGTVTLPTEGNIAVFDDVGNVVDSGENFDNIATKEYAEYVAQGESGGVLNYVQFLLEDKADKSQVDTLSEEVFELRESIENISLAEYETVNSVEEMTDTSKQYVFGTTGTVWAYGTIEVGPQNKFDRSKVSLNIRYSGAPGAEKAADGYYTTDYIPVDMSLADPLVMRISPSSGIICPSGGSKIILFDANKTALQTTYLYDNANIGVGTNYAHNAETVDGDYLINIGYVRTGTDAPSKSAVYDSIAYIRINDEISGSALTLDKVPEYTITFDAEVGEKHTWYDTGVVSIGQIRTLSAEVSELRETVAELPKIETPKIVSSVEEMTDTSKHYVLNGNIWASRTTTREGETVLVPNFTNLIKFDASENPTNVALNQRYSGSAGAAAGYLSAQNGSFAITDLVGGANYGTVYINQKPAGQSKAAHFISETITEVNGVDTINTGDWVNGENGEYKANLISDVPFVKFSAQMSTSAITADNIKGLIVTINEPISYTEQKTEDVTVEEWYDTGISYAPTLKTDLIGVLGEGNVVYLSDNLPSGTYILKYGDETYETIGTITVG